MEIKLSTVRDLHYSNVSCEEWETVESKITGSDEYDGGASYELVIRHKIDGTYFIVDFNDWDVDWEKSGFKEDEDGYSIDDGNIVDAHQVWPKQVTITVYE